jgi:hypothetical protein
VLDVPEGSGDTPCIAGGDSGAPVVIGGQARGLAIGHTAAEPCHLYYQSVVLAQGALNVKVATTAP